MGVLKQSVSANVAKRLFSKVTIQTFDTEKNIVEALLKGAVHAVIATDPLPKYLAIRYPNKVDLPLVKPLLSYKEGLAINQGDIDFLSFINSWVVARTADEWIGTTRHYWFETLNWKSQVE